MAAIPDELVVDSRRLEIHGIYLDADLVCWHDRAIIWHFCHHEIVSDLPSHCTGSFVRRSPSGCDIQFITIDIGSDKRTRRGPIRGLLRLPWCNPDVVTVDEPTICFFVRAVDLADPSDHFGGTSTRGRHGGVC